MFYLIGFFFFFFFWLHKVFVAMRAFSSCSKWRLLFIAVCMLLIAGASLIVEHRLWSVGFSSCGAWALVVLQHVDLPGAGIEFISPALAGRFLATGPPGKSSIGIFKTVSLP